MSDVPMAMAMVMVMNRHHDRLDCGRAALFTLLTYLQRIEQ